MAPRPVKISYWGSPGISASLLKNLLDDTRFQVEFVVTQPDKRRSARGTQVNPTPVKQVALERGIPVYTPHSLKKKTGELLDAWKNHSPLFNVVFAYGKIIPAALFNLPPMGTVNFHASLLPLLRGAAPIEYALWRGFEETGWTLQKMAEELDTGDILGQTRIEIQSNYTADALASALLQNLLEWAPGILTEYADEKLTPAPQDHSKATYCGKIHPDMGLVNWTNESGQIINQARALQDRPGVYSYWNKTRVKLYFNFN